MDKDTANKNKTFGENLKEQRCKKYKTQKEFAKILNIPATTYGQYETNRREPDLELVVRIAEHLGVSTDSLLTGKGTSPYINLVRNTIKENIYEYETITDESEEGWEIHGPYGQYFISKNDYTQIIENERNNFEKNVAGNIIAKLDEQRSNLYKKNDFSKVEGKMLCKSLGYNFDTVSNLALKAFGTERLYEGVVYITYFLYFTNIGKDIEGDENILFAKYLGYKALIDADVFHFDPYRKEECWWKFKSIGSLPDERTIYGELDKYYPKEQNSLVTEFLQQHWELSTEEMKMDFRIMRYIFFRFGLTKLKKKGYLSRDPRMFLFWRGPKEE